MDHESAIKYHYYYYCQKTKLLEKDTFKNLLKLKFYCLNNNICLLLYLSDKSSDVSLWLGQILVSTASKMQA